jgi:membrane-bound serine protease (ClpP class)
MEEKAVSDAAAFIRTLAREKGRNAEWAEQAVRRSVSLTAAEARAQNVVDLVAGDRRELLGQADGRLITKLGRTVRLHLRGADIHEAPMGAARRFLQVLVNPNLLYLFLLLGIYALIYEFASPGIGVGAVAGVVFLALAAYGLRILPVSYTGLLLVGLGVLLLALELVITSHGLLSVGGVGLLTLGSLFLFGGGQTPWRVSVPLIVSVAGGSLAFFTIAVGKALAARRRPAATGAESLTGRTAEAREALDPVGFVFVDGELWSARAQTPVPQGARVRIIGREGHELQVKALETEREDRHV